MGLTRCFRVYSGFCSVKVGAPFLMNTSSNDRFHQDLPETNVGLFRSNKFSYFSIFAWDFRRVIKIPDTYQGCTSSRGQSRSVLDETP